MGKHDLIQNKENYGCILGYYSLYKIEITIFIPYLFKAFISVPDFLEFSPAQSQEEDRDEGERDDVEKCGLGGAHHEQRHEGRYQTQRIAWQNKYKRTCGDERESIYGCYAFDLQIFDVTQ